MGSQYMSACTPGPAPNPGLDWDLVRNWRTGGLAILSRSHEARARGDALARSRADCGVLGFSGVYDSCLQAGAWRDALPWAGRALHLLDLKLGATQ